MSHAVKCNSCGHEEQAEQLPVDHLPSCPACAQPSLVAVDRNFAVFRPSAGDVVYPASPTLPRLQTFEELDLPASFRTAVEEELTKDEKLVWLGRPSRNPALYPSPKMVLMVVGAVLIGLAVVLPLTFKGLPIIFPGVMVMFGLFFFFAPRLLKFNPASGCQACYVVTNRRALLIERGMPGLHQGALCLTGTRCKSYHPHELLGLERRSHGQVAGAGDLIFEYIFTVGQASLAYPGSAGTVQRTDQPQRTPRGFFFLDQVGEVENLIRATLLANLEQTLDQGASVPEPGMHSRPSDAGHPAAARAEQYKEHGQVPADLKEKALAELGTNERLVWIAQPVGAIVFRRSLGYLVGGGVLAALGLLLLLGGLVGKRAGNATPGRKAAVQPRGKTAAPAGNSASAPAGHNASLGALFLVGAVCCMGVSLYRWKMAKGSCYALTNRRALVWKQGLFGLTRESYSPVEVAAMRRSDSWLFEAGGDLIFRSVTVVTTSRKSASVSTTHYGFLAVARVKEVEKLVRETLIDRFVDRLQAANSL